jgi:hypothetical protein
VRVAFYAPLKVPSHGTPSGDRRVAALYVEALQQAGHRVELASSLSSYDPRGNPERQAALRAQGLATAEQLVRQLQSGAQESRPDLWFTYHVYYKAPDWLGPHVSRALGIPYVIAEASHAPKRAGGPWNLGHEASAEAMRWRTCWCVRPVSISGAWSQSLQTARRSCCFRRFSTRNRSMKR